MRTMRCGAAILVLAIIAMTLTGAEPARQEIKVDEIGTQALLVGQLGKPLGTFVTISGTKDKDWMRVGQPMIVDTVDGKKLDKSVMVAVDGAPPMTKGSRYSLRGYENCGMRGSPTDPEDGDASQVQQTFYFTSWFQMTKQLSRR